MLVVTPQPFFEERGTPVAVRYLLQVLGELGYEVDLVAFPVGRDVPLCGVTVHRVPNILGIRAVPIGFSFRKLFLDFFLTLKVRKLLKANDYCYIHAVEEAAFIIAMMPNPPSTPFIYDMASSIPEQLKDTPLVSLEPLQRMMRAVEAKVISRASHVLCSRGLIDQVYQQCSTTMASEWWFPSMPVQASSREQAETLREELGIQRDEKLFVYTGSFAPYQGIKIILDAVTLLGEHRQDVRFLLVGATSRELEIINKKAAEQKPGGLITLGRVPREKIGKFLMAADVLISPRLFGNNVPLKIFDYMGAGKPIIASDIPAHRSVLNTDTAVFFDNTSDGLLRAISELLNSPETAAKLSDNSSRYAEQYLTWGRFRDDLNKIIDQVQGINRVKMPEPPSIANRGTMERSLHGAAKVGK